MGTLVGVKLVVGVWLGGIRVAVGVGTDLSCNLHAERETRMQNEENTMRNIRNDLWELVLERQVILFCANGNINDKGATVYFTYFRVV